MIRSASSIEVNLPIRVLVADDSDVMRRTVTRYLSTRSEVEVVGEASNFEEAARLAGEHRPEIVVIDVRMSRLVDTIAAIGAPGELGLVYIYIEGNGKTTRTTSRNK
jgi:AmiR/NasT family two-component response regulator